MNTDIIILLAKLKKLHKTFIENTNSTSSSIKHLGDEIVRLEELILNIGGGGSGGEGGLNESQVNILIKRQIDELQAVIENEINGLRTELTEQIKSNTDNIEQVTVKLENVNKEINSIKEQLTLLQTDNVEIKESLTTMENALNETNEEITVMLTKIEDTVKEIEVLRQEVKVIKGNLQKQIDEIKTNSGITMDEVNDAIGDKIHPINIRLSEIENRLEEIENNSGGGDGGGGNDYVTKDEMQEAINSAISSIEYDIFVFKYNIENDLDEIKKSLDGEGVDRYNYSKLRFVERNGLSPVSYNQPFEIYVRDTAEVVGYMRTINVIADFETYWNTYCFPKATLKLSPQYAQYYDSMMLKGGKDNRTVNVDIELKNFNSNHTLSLEMYDRVKVNTVNTIRPSKFEDNIIAMYQYDIGENENVYISLMFKNKVKKVYNTRLSELQKYGIIHHHVDLSRDIDDVENPKIDIEFIDKDTGELINLTEFADSPIFNESNENNIYKYVLNKHYSNITPYGKFKNTKNKPDDNKMDIDVTKYIKFDENQLNKVRKYYKNTINNIIIQSSINEFNTITIKNNPYKLPDLKFQIELDSYDLSGSLSEIEIEIENDNDVHWDFYEYNGTEDNPIPLFSNKYLIGGDVNPNIYIAGLLDSSLIKSIAENEIDLVGNERSVIEIAVNFNGSMPTINSDKITKIVNKDNTITYTGEVIEGQKENEVLLRPRVKSLNVEEQQRHDNKIFKANIDINMVGKGATVEFKTEGEGTQYTQNITDGFGVYDKTLKELYEDAVQGNGIIGKVYSELNNQLIEGERLHLDTNIDEESNKDIVSHQKYAYYKNNIMQKINSINIANSLKVMDSWNDLINKGNLGELKNVFNMLSGEIKLTETLANSLVNIINTKVLLQLTKDGDLRIGGQLQSNYADYAEMFELETPLSEDDKIAKIVKLNSNGKVEFTQKGDKPLGIVSVNASVVGDNPHQWKGMYVKDRYGREIKGIVLQYSPFVQFDDEEEINNILTKLNDIRKQNELIEVVNIKKSEDDNEDEVILINRPLTLKDVLNNIDAIPEDKVDEVEQLIKYTDGITNTIRDLYKDLDDMNLLNVKEISILVELYKTKQLDKEEEFTLKDIKMNTGSVLSLTYDSNKSYIMREHRDEWVKVGLLGKLIVSYEGNVKTGDYLTTGDNGKAILSTSESNMQVLEVVDEELALVYFK